MKNESEKLVRERERKQKKENVENVYKKIKCQTISNPKPKKLISFVTDIIIFIFVSFVNISRLFSCSFLVKARCFTRTYLIENMCTSLFQFGANIACVMRIIFTYTHTQYVRNQNQNSIISHNNRFGYRHVVIAHVRPSIIFKRRTSKWTKGVIARQRFMQGHHYVYIALENTHINVVKQQQGQRPNIEKM